MKRLVWGFAALASLVMPLSMAFGADPVATSLDSSAAKDYLGTWALSMDFQGNPVEMTLTVVDIGGKIGATINNERMPEATAVTAAALDDAGITLTYDMDFGGNAFTIDIKGKVENGAFAGTLAEQSGLFTADFTGKPGSAEAPAEEAGPAPVATSLDTSAAADYVGNWKLSMDFQGNQVPMDLSVMDVGGKIGAIVNSEQAPEPAVITEATKDDSGLTLMYDMDFGGQAFSIAIKAVLADGKMTGTFAEKSGLFTANFTGEKGEPTLRVAAGGGGGEGEGRRRGGGGGGGGRRGGGPSAKLTIDGKDISISFAPLEKGSEDYDKLAGLKDGSLFLFVGGRATKLRTDHNLKFGETIVKKENAAPNYPGVYSLWLKKVSNDDWRLIFNEHADIWGTQHDAAADAAEIPVKAGTAATEAEAFTVELKENGAAGGTLRIAFGAMEWTADFTTVN